MLLVNKICEHLSERIEAGQLSNEDLVKIIEHVGGYLNLQSISNYAATNKMSYNGVKKFRNVQEIFKTKFVIDNA
jgi:hypothetical protein